MAATAAGRATRAVAALICGAWLAGCATYSENFAVVEHHLVRQRYDLALQALEAQSHPPRDRVLYLLNRGMLKRMLGDFTGSNESFEAAKPLMEKLYATSVSETAASFIINDATRSYAGEEYEQVLVHLYMALNYLQLRDLDAARVEALQVDEKLRDLGARIAGNKYSEDALARTLTGLIYEEREEWSDALIAYRKAYEVYREQRRHFGVDVPLYLKHALLRLTERQGLTEELRGYRREFGIERWMTAEELARHGEVVFVLHNGLAPILREQSAAIMDIHSGHLVRLSLPYYESRPPPVTRARLVVAGTETPGALAEDIDAIARASLEAKLPAITARAVARQVAKAKLVNEVKRSARERAQGGKDGDALAAAMVGIGAEIAAFATERADTRSWVTLPHDIQLARLALPPGRHAVRVELLGAYHEPVAILDFPDVEVSAGKKTYLSRHWMPSSLSVPRR